MAVSEAALGELREALAEAGLALPSLGLDLVTCAQEKPNPLISLGCCHRGTALRLASVLRAGSSR